MRVEQRSVAAGQSADPQATHSKVLCEPVDNVHQLRVPLGPIEPSKRRRIQPQEFSRRNCSQALPRGALPLTRPSSMQKRTPAWTPAQGRQRWSRRRSHPTPRESPDPLPSPPPQRTASARLRSQTGWSGWSAAAPEVWCRARPPRLPPPRAARRTGNSRGRSRFAR